MFCRTGVNQSGWTVVRQRIGPDAGTARLPKYRSFGNRRSFSLFDHVHYERAAFPLASDGEHVCILILVFAKVEKPVGHFPRKA